MAVTKEKRDLSSSRKIVVATCLLLLALISWNKYSSIQLHLSYQNTLMDSVTNSVLSDYQEHLTQLRATIDQFQYRHFQALNSLSTKGSLAEKDAYMDLLNQLKKDVPDSRLFAIVNNKGDGVLKHITGDFLPDCKEEIHSTLASGSQEHIFLHRSKSSIHFDLLEPLMSQEAQGWFFFVAFNTEVFEQLLRKYQLPHQELFLLRKDNIGKIELSSEIDNLENKINTITMEEEDVQAFTFLKDIPRTRWQLAIRMAPEYSSRIVRNGVLEALLLWLCASSLILIFYKALRQRINRQSVIEKELEFESSHDSLTGTINRSTFEKSLAESMSKAADELSSQGCVLLIDIDNFQLVNNNHGYGQGDSCLNLLSNWLIAYLPDNAIVSRLGNDEFAVIIEDLSHANTFHFANTLRNQIQHLRFTQLSHEISLTASIGVYQLNNEDHDVSTILTCLSHAVKLAKHKGRNCVQIYQSEDSALQQHAQEMNVLSHVKRALADDKFHLHRQKIICIQSKETKPKYEILLRLTDNNGELIPPNLFIPASEKYGLITEIDRWVIRHTLAAIAALEPDLSTRYSINLSGVTLADQHIYEFVCEQLAKYDIAPERIGFEITETYAITHLDAAIAFISQMTSLGCEFSLDDFGSGLSSFSYLQQLPVHNIKIDGSFVKDICTNPLNKVFVESMHKVATEMGKKTIAEFVEDKETEALLVTLGVNMAQGYQCHKPEYWYHVNQ